MTQLCYKSKYDTRISRSNSNISEAATVALRQGQMFLMVVLSDAGRGIRQPTRCGRCHREMKGTTAGRSCRLARKGSLCRHTVREPSPWWRMCYSVWFGGGFQERWRWLAGAALTSNLTVVQFDLTCPYCGNLLSDPDCPIIPMDLFLLSMLQNRPFFSLPRGSPDG